MSSNVQNGEKMFDYYLNFPPEIRTEVIKEMRPDDKCRFTRCSKLCSEEVRKSDGYIQGLQFFWFLSENRIQISVHFHSKQEKEIMGFNLTFREKNQKKYIEYEKSVSTSGVLWSVDLASFTNIVQLGFEYFEQYILEYQRTIRRLTLCGTNDGYFSVNSLNKLEELTVDNHREFLHYTSKMKRPLKRAIRYTTKNKLLPLKCKNLFQLYEVQEYFYAPDIRMDYEHFLKFSAKAIAIHIGKLTPIDLSNFIKSWQNGTICKGFIFCQFTLDHSRFKVQQFFEYLNLEYNGSESVEFEIKHNIEAGKVAKLDYSRAGHWKRITFDARDETNDNHLRNYGF